MKAMPISEFNTAMLEHVRMELAEAGRGSQTGGGDTGIAGMRI